MNENCGHNRYPLNGRHEDGLLLGHEVGHHRRRLGENVLAHPHDCNRRLLCAPESFAVRIVFVIVKDPHSPTGPPQTLCHRLLLRHRLPMHLRKKKRKAYVF